MEDDDDDEGFSSSKWVPRSDNPLHQQEMRELEETALAKNKELTDATLNLRKIAEDTKGVAGQTLVTLKEQGDQIVRIHEKTVKMDQELEKGEKLLSKLGGMLTFGYKPKKAKKITGPSMSANASDSAYGDNDSREALGLNGKGGKGGGYPPKAAEDMSVMDKLEMERKFQDQVLDDVSDSLDILKNMAQEMGTEMERQDKGIEELGEDIKEINSRVKQSNTRARKLLGRR